MSQFFSEELTWAVEVVGAWWHTSGASFLFWYSWYLTSQLVLKGNSQTSVVHTCNPSVQDADCEFNASLSYRVRIYLNNNAKQQKPQAVKGEWCYFSRNTVIFLLASSGTYDTSKKNRLNSIVIHVPFYTTGM